MKSDTHSLFGAGARNRRFAWCSGHGPALSLMVMRTALLRITPARPISRISRSTVHRPTAKPYRIIYRQTLRTPWTAKFAGGVAEVAGSSQAFSTTQPSLGINYIINTGGLFPQREVGPYGGEYMLGEVTAYAGLASQLPRGWLIADGSILSINQNAALFALLGTTYGGNGSTTFALPDLRGRIVVGAGSRDGVTMVPGQVAGQSSVALSIGNLPVHNHSLSDVPAVPEPTTWAMMLVGFGMIGATTRYRRRSAKVTYA